MSFQRACSVYSACKALLSLSLLSLSVLLTALLPSGAAQAQELVAVPALAGHVNDHAAMLDSAQRARLEQTLADYEAGSGSQIVILTVDSTAPEAIEQYGIRVADAWKIGRVRIDDGVILIVAKNNPKALRRLRIEAGRGVQGSLTDAQSKRVLEDIIAPHFRQNDYYGGLNAGAAAISALLNNEQLPAPQQHAQAPADDGSGWIGLLPIVFFFVLVVIARNRARARNNLGANGWGNAAGVVLGSILSQSGRGGGGFTGGGIGRGGFGGGGFSGGGGGFDGGGASGDW
ncbi:YgcG family protein [Oxalobacteraceae bacterium CAVE-383]|nr:YgcG family protein [Oxalobacteraceae bacterium CAVE-383]